MKRNAFEVVTLADEASDKKFWLERTPEERLKALELSRQILYGYNPATNRLQRILEIAELKSD